MTFRHRVYLAAATALVAAAQPCVAQYAYPHEVVTLVTHSSPGGGSDVFLRELARYLGPALGVEFVVENVRGGSGARAMARLASAPADGRIFYAVTPTYIYTSLLSRPANSFNDLEPLVNVFFDEEVVYTRADGPLQTLADVIATARSRRGRWGASTPASLERQALESLLGIGDPIVRSTGGGLVTGPEPFELLKQSAQTVWLRAKADRRSVPVRWPTIATVCAMPGPASIAHSGAIK